MDLEKNYIDRLPTQEQIKDSLNRYFGFMHSKINALGDLDPSRIMKMTTNGWDMESSKENIQQLIDDFVNIYGYIYKEGQSLRSGKLIRGTTTDEATRIHQGGEISTILSTTTDENIAKHFCEYGNAALIRIRTSEELPYVYVEDLKEHGENEEEVLILPFSKVEKAEFTSNWQGFKYYDVTLGKAELPEISEEELEKLKESSIKGYDDFTIQLKEYEQLYYQHVSTYEQIAYSSNKREIIEKARAISEKIRPIREKIDIYRSNMQQMLKGLCRQREKDIDLEKQDELQAIQEERKHKEQQRLEKLRQEIEELKKGLSNKSESIEDKTQANVERFIKTIQQYKQLSDKFGVRTFNSQNLEYDIQLKEAVILQEVKGETAQKEEQQDIEPDTEYGILLDMLQKKEIAEELLQEAPELLKRYEEQSMLDLKNNLNKKVQDIIYRTTYYRLNTEKQVILSKKDTIFSKLLGKTKLNQAKVSNIDARINYAAKQKEVQNPSNSIREMLYNMYECACKLNGGSLTQEMAEVEQAIRSTFSNLPNQDTIIQQVYNTQTIGFPTTEKRKGIFTWLTNAKETQRLNNETAMIYQQTENINFQQIQKPSENLISIYSRFNSILQRVGQLVAKDNEQEKKLDKEINNEEIK